ncbi:hypothetical protein [Streptomyces sp. NPDC046939]
MAAKAPGHFPTVHDLVELLLQPAFTGAAPHHCEEAAPQGRWNGGAKELR